MNNHPKSPWIRVSDHEYGNGDVGYTEVMNTATGAIIRTVTFSYKGKCRYNSSESMVHVPGEKFTTTYDENGDLVEWGLYIR